jgi:hypothetical protein
MLELYKEEIKNLTTSEARTLAKEIQGILDGSYAMSHSDTLEKIYKLCPKPEIMGPPPFEGAKNHGLLRDILSDIKRSMNS